MSKLNNVEKVKLNSLKATNPYLRMGTDVSDLEKSISTVGLIAPLVVSKDNVILAGARRFQALLNLGHTEANAIIIDGSELEKELISIDENLVRKDLNKLEIEAHLRRAKEIYQALHPEDEFENHESPEDTIQVSSDQEPLQVEKKKVIKLPAEKFLNIVAEKTGLSPKQIHEAINRDESADESVKEARKNGELSLSQTNEIIKLSKDEQKAVLKEIKTLPVKEIRKFVKKAKAEGVSKAISTIERNPHAKDFLELENILKRALKKVKQLELEGITVLDYPDNLKEIFTLLNSTSGFHFSEDNDFSANEYSNH